MKNNFNSFVLAFIFLTVSVVSSFADSVTVEAESGVLGSNFTNNTQSGVTYISISTDLVNTGYPGNANRVATYSVTFPSPGTYDLYARMRVGPGGANDDSMFYANGFGTKSPTTASDWILVNNLYSGGFTSSTDIVTGGGTAGIQVWKWIDLSQLNNGASGTPITFTVTAGNLTQTFQIGARENGFDMDKFVFGTTSNTFTVAQLDAGSGGTPPPPPPAPTPKDMVNGNLIQFNDNGAWTWYSDERTVVDKTKGNLIVGSDASSAGTGGSPREGDVEAVIYNMASGNWQRYTLKDGATDPGAFYADDHNTPGLLVRPDGKYLAWYCGHNTETTNYWRNFDGTNWTAEQLFDWNTIPGGTDFNETYSNPHYLSAEGRIYNFVRANDHGCPNFLVSTDNGNTWSFGGQLISSLTNINVGYVSGYFKYCDNGSNRIDFIGTETHPRDSSTSMWHGYVKNGQSFKSDGTLVDANIFDQTAPVITQFTEIFTNGTVSPPGQTNYRCWNDDIQSYPDGTVECIIATRINDDTQGNDANIAPDHAFFFCRYDGTNWNNTYLCQAGTKLYSSEADYIGLGSLSPNDPNTIFVSTQYDPRAVQPGVTDTNQPYSTAHEIWKGITTNNGVSFTWTPITQSSVRDNLRPIVPLWDQNNTTLLWFRVNYTSAQIFDAQPVGLIERHSETPATMTYVDADTTNTTLATGAPLVTGTGTGQWHLRTGSGNNGTILASADVTGEDAPTIETTATLPSPGTYDVWANFWGAPAADWRVMAGLATNQMQIFRSVACKEIQPGDHDSSLVLSNSNGSFLYQAYVGRVTASSSNTVSVFIDDNAIATGTTSPLVGNTVRTWYDGISFAQVNPLHIMNAAYNGNAVTLTWNSVSPENSLTTPSYSVQKKNSLTDANWIALTNGISSGGSTTTFIDTTATGDAAFYRISWP